MYVYIKHISRSVIAYAVSLMYLFYYYIYSIGPSLCAVAFFVWAIIDTLIPILFLTPFLALLALFIKERKRVEVMVQLAIAIII